METSKSRVVEIERPQAFFACGLCVFAQSFDIRLAALLRFEEEAAEEPLPPVSVLFEREPPFKLISLPPLAALGADEEFPPEEPARLFIVCIVDAAEAAAPTAVPTDN